MSGIQDVTLDVVEIQRRGEGKWLLSRRHCQNLQEKGASEFVSR